ncbi:MAG: hypothetical protein IPO72_18710 [Saprospiraceae bacterium]|nr:hypothetical protein [Candidatus Vicinibacter affinis]MBK6572193.1 hypothetical protein [Candidatus Vicinibacter affinis]MBK7305347.1 hypothetical protein [Candidatus Vicinibacter affinis]MBK7799570.1 hypothetical protein [Candidatus Vicinibacter affinis]MBK8643897.1 hypothetical protein [Candidatus Vicinibacter affinis]
MEIFKNKVFGNYTTLDYLGKGSFTSVYPLITDITFEYTLYNDIIEPIRRNSSTTPVFGVFFDTRDEGGHFFFVKRKKTVQ